MKTAGMSQDSRLESTGGNTVERHTLEDREVLFGDACILAFQKLRPKWKFGGNSELRNGFHNITG